MSTSRSKSVAFYAAARGAVEQYAREHARLPAFKTTRPDSYNKDRSKRSCTVPPIVDLYTCGAVQGEVLSQDTWLTLLPLEDLLIEMSAETKWQLLVKRVRFMRLLSSLADSPDFPLDSSIDCVGVDEEHPRESFWWELLLALAPDNAQMRTRVLQRHLAALSRGGKLRILISVETSWQGSLIASALELLFQALCAIDDDYDDAYSSVEAACGLTSKYPVRPVEIGLELLPSKVHQLTKIAMTAVLNGVSSLSGSAVFSFSTLRFGPKCYLTTPAATLLGDRLNQLSLNTLQLGGTRNVAPIALRRTMTSAATSVRRLVTTDREKSICAMASALRASGDAVREVDIACCINADLGEWLALSVFHENSNAKVSSLCVRASDDSKCFSVADFIQQFKRVLCTADVTAADAKRVDPTGFKSRIRHFVQFASGTKVDFPTYARKETTVLLPTNMGGLAFEVLGEDDQEVVVVIPGIGIGRAPTSSIQGRFTKSMSVIRCRMPYAVNRNVTSLTFCIGAPINRFHYFSRWSSECSSMLIELLSIVGEPLQRLSLPHLCLSDADVGKIFEYCPHLTELNISYNDACDLSSIYVACSTGQCKLKTLSFLRTCSIYQTASEQHITHWTNSVLRLPFERLVIHACPIVGTSYEDQRVYVETHMLPLVSALRSLRQLEYLELQAYYPLSRALPTDLTTPSTLFAALSMRQKLAYLSVVQQKVDSAVGNLDAAVLTQIFQFCGRRRTLIVTER